MAFAGECHHRRWSRRRLRRRMPMFGDLSSTSARPKSQAVQSVPSAGPASACAEASAKLRRGAKLRGAKARRWGATRPSASAAAAVGSSSSSAAATSAGDAAEERDLLCAAVRSGIAPRSKSASTASSGPGALRKLEMGSWLVGCRGGCGACPVTGRPRGRRGAFVHLQCSSLECVEWLRGRSRWHAGQFQTTDVASGTRQLFGSLLCERSSLRLPAMQPGQVTSASSRGLVVEVEIVG
jgi:hypothetical protein